MAIRLIRLDDRLLHGQVVVGWGRHLDLAWYVVVDDDLAGSAAEQELYAAGLPEGVEVEFVDVERAVRTFDALERREEPGCVLLRETETVAGLAREGLLEGRRVVLGPVGAGPRRRAVLDFLHLSPSEEEDLRTAARAGAEVVARELPSSRGVPLSELIDGA